MMSSVGIDVFPDILDQIGSTMKDVFDKTSRIEDHPRLVGWLLYKVNDYELKKQ